ncbi:hypothetical protein L210DRAFT_2031624 [Boletus edulis BED1]|uniref:UBA domain-containing protein n=1 Tax=Boletus edulis BED1 TaxID=1328754 RepID=A0AAD4C9G3_BOLED|nr:hypothetical protein L210DRAFT_2031624 [Boletus edulis BED1]
MMGSPGMKSTGGLRDLLSSVAQQVESHLHPSLSPVGGRRGQVGRRRSRIRSWITQDKNKNGARDKEDEGDSNRSDGGDNSLHFTDTSSDDFSAVDDISTHRKRKNKYRNEVFSPNDDQNQGIQTQTNIATKHNTKTKMHMLPDEIKEEETVDMLTGLMGEGFDREVTRRILRKYDGNVDKAAGALLEGERGEEFIGHTPGPGQIQSQGWPAIQGAGPSASSWSAGPAQTQTPSSQTSQTRLDSSSALGGRPNTPVIDLTLDDDPDLQRAVQESMSTLHSGSQSQMQVYAPSYTQAQLQTQSLSQVYAPSQGQGQPDHMQVQSPPVFGPSERPSDPNWAVVPSHQNESNEANYLQNLNRAIEASLETMGDSDALEPFPVEQQLRRNGCPVVLRPSMHTMVYAASILQGLFYVPQVRRRMASWRPPMPTNEEEVALPMGGLDFTLWALSEIFTHMDLARLCDLNVDKRLPAFNIEPWDRPAQPPGELSRKFFARLSATLEKAFVEQFAHSGQPLPKPRLLHFQYGSGISEPGELLQETSIVPIDVNGGESNDLIGRLSVQPSKLQSEPGKQCVIFEPSEVVAFELVRPSSTPGTTANGNGSDRKPFTYPKSIYLDQFLRKNVELAQTKRAQKREMLQEVQQLLLHKNTLTHFDNKDTLKDLRSAIFYFETVADAKDDLEREVSIQATTWKLKSILTTIEDEVKATDERINMLRTEAETLLDCEELQQFKYDLRVVFVHDGLYGRKHLYSYVHDKSCWWKIADSLIEKVSEDTVLNDQAGLHLGAGPYLLLYSRICDSPAPVLPWMDDIKDDVKAANREFLSQLPPELVGDIVRDEEDVSFPGITSSGPVMKNGRVGERMDVS